MINNTTIFMILIVVCVLLYLVWNKKQEGFAQDFKQIDNLIASQFSENEVNTKVIPQRDNLQKRGYVNPNAVPTTTSANNATNTNQSSVTSEFTPKFSSKVILEDTYVIKQIVIPKIEGNFRIGVKNTGRNKISYVSGLELNHEDVIDVFADNSPKYVMMTLNNSTNDSKYSKTNPTDIYGNELIGNEIIIYTEQLIPFTGTGENKIYEIFIMGHEENEHYHDQHDDISEVISSDKVSINVNDDENLLKQFSEGETPYGITKITFNELPETKTKKIKVQFQNNYSNNTFTFRGPLSEREFIVNGTYNTIFFHHTLLANNLVIKDSSTPYIKSDNIMLYGYTPSIDDVNRFKLEYDLTDVRGSINPDDVCPSLDQYMNDQLSSELVIDAMEYQDRINMEKMKLANNKDSMLTLLEQEEEIQKLDRMVNKINSLHQQRTHTNNALNALQLSRQLDEILKLREVLDSRIALRKQNSIDVPINVNRVKYVKPGEENLMKKEDEIDQFADIPLSKEDNMTITKG